MVDDVKNTLSLFSQGLVGRLRHDCMTDWKKFMNHPFVKDLARGTLPKAYFQRFLIQDYLYLLDYARVEALAIYKSRKTSEMRYFVSLINGMFEVELNLHLNYCDTWGIDRKSLEKAPKSMELIAYTQYLLNKSMQGDLLDIMILMLPCLVGYGEIGLNMLQDKETVKQGNPYLSWMEVYSGKEYHSFIRESLAFLERIGSDYGVEQRYPMILDEFRMVVQLETMFWNTGKGL